MIPFNDLAAQRRRLGTELDDAIHEVIESGRFINGPAVRELEAALAEYTGRKHAIACANGTDALRIALMAMNIGPGDAVFTSPFTFFATAEVVGNVGATPVFSDIDAQTFNLDPVLLEKAIQKVLSEGQLKPKGIIAVDIFGQLADYDAICAVAEKYGLWVMEDGAQSFGACCGKKRACSFGLVSTTSFFPAKPLGCYGDGGMIFTNDDELAALSRSITVHGKGRDKYDNIRLGLNSRLDTIQAVILLKKFSIFPDEIMRRDVVARRYTELLSDVVITPTVLPGTISVWAQYSIRTPKRAEVMAALKEAEIPSAIYYPTPLHRATVFTALGYGENSLPEAEQLTGEVLSLPMHPYLEESMQATISDVIHKVFQTKDH